MRPDIVPGAGFPDYELSDHRGKRRKLSALQGPDPMVVILSRGALGNKRVLKAETIEQMSRNQIGDLNLVPLGSLLPKLATNPIHMPGLLDKFGLGFAINTKAVEGGRAAGSLAWAGIFNTYFWIDPTRKICAVIMTQTLPFSDGEAVSTVEKFERAVYAETEKTVPAKKAN